MLLEITRALASKEGLRDILLFVVKRVAQVLRVPDQAKGSSSE